MGAAPSSTRGGPPCAAQPIRAGDDTPWLPTRARAAPRCADGGRRQSCWRAQRCGSRLASGALASTAGEPTSGMGRPSSTRLGRLHTQTIERTHITWRTRSTRWVRRTIRCAKTERRHDVVMGFFINRSALGRLLGDAINSSATPSRLLRARGHVWQGEGRWTCLPIRTRPI